MAAIKYDFPSLPENPSNEEVVGARLVMANPSLIGKPEQGAAQDVLSWRYAHDNLAGSLAELKLPPPPAGADRAAIVAHLQELLGQIIANELEEDPDDLYPDDGTDEEIARLLNEEQSGPGHEDGVPDVGKDGKPIVDKDGNPIPWRAHRLPTALRAFPYGPNALTAADVAAARRK